jgi:hypothetical protein
MTEQLNINEPPKVSGVGAFKKNKYPTVELPSGAMVRVRRPGMEKFLAAGFLPEPMAKQVRQQINNRTGRVQDMDMLKDPSNEEIEAMLRVMDRVSAYCFVEPALHWHERPVKNANGQDDVEEIPLAERDPELLYTDEVDLVDKQFVFQYAVGGTSDLDQFRESTSTLVEAIQPGEGVVDSPEPAPAAEQ